MQCNEGPASSASVSPVVNVHLHRDKECKWVPGVAKVVTTTEPDPLLFHLMKPRQQRQMSPKMDFDVNSRLWSTSQPEAGYSLNFSSSATNCEVSLELHNVSIIVIMFFLTPPFLPKCSSTGCLLSERGWELIFQFCHLRLLATWPIMTSLSSNDQYK